VLTGDNDGECGLFVADEDFKILKRLEMAVNCLEPAV